MKVIDLLNKIANGQIEYEQKIKIDNEIITVSHLLGAYIFSKERFNDEVEIIEEDKKIEKIDLSEWSEITYQEDWALLTKDFNRNSCLFVKKINEIIDYINEKYIYDDIGMKIFDASTLQDKLQELKGSDKE